MKIIDLLSPNELDLLNKLIQEYKSGDEFEVSLFSSKETGSDLLSLENIERLHSALTRITEKNEDKYKKTDEHSLDVIFSLKNLNNKNSFVTYRITILGMEKINLYMGMLHQRKNNLIFEVLLGFISEDKNNLKIIKKIKNVSKYILLEDLYMKIKLDHELEPTKEELKKLSKITQNYDINSYDILFRFKDRKTYYYNINKNFFKIDITKTQTVHSINDLEKSSIRNEIEIECEPTKNAFFSTDLFSVCEILIKIIQQSNYIITKSQNSKIIEKYRDILGITKSNNLYGRRVVSLEIQHTIDDLPNKYAVTDKADGSRFMLIVVDNRCYFISTNLIVKDTGISVSEKYNNTIVDGELIYLKKINKYLYMIFDCLVLGNDNIREESSIMKRLEQADKFIEEFNKLKYKHKNIDNLATRTNFNNKEELIKYHYNNLKEFYEDIDNELKNKDLKILCRRKYFIPCNGIEDSEIFTYSTLLWNTFTKDSSLKCPYLLDGLIYQPTSQKYIVEREKSKFADYKWKPDNMNSIDFYIEFEKDKTGNVIFAYDNTVLDTLKNKPYKICNLYVGINIKGVEKPILFNSENGKNQAYLLLDETGEVRTVDGVIIQDKTVVEFAYDLKADVNDNFRWIPLRVRYDKTESVQKNHTNYGNYVDVSLRIWRSINNPVTEDDLKILSDKSTYEIRIKQLRDRIDYSSLHEEKKLEVYYQKKSNLATEMRSFNNYLKSNMIYTYFNWRYNNNYKNKILDIGCGRGGDIEKYFYVEPEYVLGFDLDLHGLTNSLDGAISRYINFQKKHPNIPPMYFIQASATSLLEYDEQLKVLGRQMNNEMKKTFNKFFGKENNILFDRAHCGFTIHYYLQNELTWNNFCINLNNYLRDGGYFMFQTFDANLIKNKFKDTSNNKYSVYYDKDGDKKLSYELIKKWDDKEQSPYGNILDVYMSWTFEEGVYQSEYLVYPDFIIKSLNEKCNLELVETDIFENFYNNNKEFLKLSSVIEEGKLKKFLTSAYAFYSDTDDMKSFRDYTFLNRYYVFRKKEKNLEETKKYVEKNNIKLNKNELESIYLKRKNKNK